MNKGDVLNMIRDNTPEEAVRLIEQKIVEIAEESIDFGFNLPRDYDVGIFEFPEDHFTVSHTHPNQEAKSAEIHYYLNDLNTIN